MLPASRRVARGKNDGEARAARAAVDEHEAAMRFDRAVHDGEPEPAAVRPSS